MLYYCQLAIKRILDHMIPLPVNLKVDNKFLYRCNETEFIDGLYTITKIVKDIYEDMIENPDEYGLPLIEISQAVTSPKDKRLAINSTKWLITLLFIMGRTGTITQSGLRISIDEFKQYNESIKPKDRVKNVSVLLNKILNFGFLLDGSNEKFIIKGRDNFTLSYPGNVNVIKALKGYMISAEISYELYSMHSYFVLHEQNRTDNQQCIDFYNYLNECDKTIFEEFDTLLKKSNYECRKSNSYSYVLEYFDKNDSDNYVVRCFSEENQLEIVLRLRNMNRYVNEILSLPVHIQYLFKTTTCNYCNSKGNPTNSVKCHYRIEWIIEEQTYASCSCTYFRIKNADYSDLKYYVKLLLFDKQPICKTIKM